MRDGQVLISMMWTSEDSGFIQHGDFARRVAIEPATDIVFELTDDTRSASLSPAGVTSDGTAHFSPCDFHAVVRGVFGDGFGSASCVLCVLPSASTLDPGYDVDLTTLVGGRPAGGLQRLNNREALPHVWHDDRDAATPETWPELHLEPGDRTISLATPPNAPRPFARSTPAAAASPGWSCRAGS